MRIRRLPGRQPKGAGRPAGGGADGPADRPAPPVEGGEKRARAARPAQTEIAVHTSRTGGKGPFDFKERGVWWLIDNVHAYEPAADRRNPTNVGTDDADGFEVVGHERVPTTGAVPPREPGSRRRKRSKRRGRPVHQVSIAAYPPAAFRDSIRPDGREATTRSRRGSTVGRPPAPIVTGEWPTM